MSNSQSQTQKSVPHLAVHDALKQRLLEQIPKLAGKKILIVGDVGLDEYILGEVRRISPEAPVPVLEVEKEDLRLGLSANVAQNIRSLGGIPMLVSVVGKDSGAELLSKLFQQMDVSTNFLIVDPDRPTTRKVRVMAKHHHLVRVDYELRKYLSADTEKKFLNMIEQNAKEADAIIIQDYAKGVISDSLLKGVISIAKKLKKKIMVDPHRSNHGDFYHGVDLIKPNYDEAVALSGLNHDDLRDHPNKVIEIGEALLKKTGATELVITRGKDGMTIFSGGKIEQVPTYARQVFDVTGAGDTVIAALSLGIVSGLPLSEACMLANFAAGVVVGQVGCVPCTVTELKEYIQSAGT